MSKNAQPTVRIPTIRQLPSGAYNCRLRLEGQSISITDFDYDRVAAKAYAYKAGVIKAQNEPLSITVGKALDNYISARKDVLSPSTLRGYVTIRENRFQSLQQRRLNELTQNIIQREVNAESTLCSPKTLRNAYMLIVSAMNEAGLDTFSNIKLPQVQRAEKQYLTPEQIGKLTEAVKGTKYEIPVLLGLWSCRRSEIFGLKWDCVDLDARTITIRRTVIPNANHVFIERENTKTVGSTRVIPISDQLHKALNAVENKEGNVVTGSPNILGRNVNRICAEIGLPAVGVHGLRHSFASLAYKLNIPAKIAMKIGGWESDRTMLEIYTHVSESDVESYAEDLLNFFNGGKADANETPMNS